MSTAKKCRRVCDLSVDLWALLVLVDSAELCVLCWRKRFLWPFEMKTWRNNNTLVVAGLEDLIESWKIDAKTILTTKVDRFSCFDTETETKLDPRLSRKFRTGTNMIRVEAESFKLEVDLLRSKFDSFEREKNLLEQQKLVNLLAAQLDRLTDDILMFHFLSCSTLQLGHEFEFNCNLKLWTPANFRNLNIMNFSIGSFWIWEKQKFSTKGSIKFVSRFSEKSRKQEKKFEFFQIFQ